MKRPIDPRQDLSKEEKIDQEKDLEDLEITPAEERAMIWAAIKTILPPVTLGLILLAVIVFLIF